MYRRPTIDERLNQGDIVDGCPIFGLDPHDTTLVVESMPTRWTARVIVVTQDCDLANPKTTRAVVAILRSTEDLVSEGVLTPQLIRDRIRRHQVFGWYFLPQADDEVLPESLVELRHLYTVPRAILEQLVERGNRICTLETPYREHLAQHFANTYARIGLPEPYETNK